MSVVHTGYVRVGIDVSEDRSFRAEPESPERVNWPTIDTSYEPDPEVSVELSMGSR
jgi:hypothetical protein